MRGPNRREVTPRVLQTFARYVASVRWKFAKTMPHIPHWYTVRPLSTARDKTLEDAFCDAVELIREYGYEVQWGRSTYTKLDLNGMCYWTMGNPLADTTIINRGALPLDTPTPGPIVPDFTAPEQAAILAAVGCLSTRTVLDASPASGWLLHHLYDHPARYLALEPQPELGKVITSYMATAEPIQCQINGYAGGPVDVALDLFNDLGSFSPDWHRHFIAQVRPGGRWLSVVRYGERTWFDRPEVTAYVRHDLAGRYVIRQGAVG